MTVLLSYQNITDIFTILLAVLIGVLYFFMGATLDLQVVKGIIKKPVGPVVGVLCQYGFMPMVSTPGREGKKMGGEEGRKENGRERGKEDGKERGRERNWEG